MTYTFWLNYSNMKKKKQKKKIIEICVFDKIIDTDIFGKFRNLDLTVRSSLSQYSQQIPKKQYFDTESSSGLTDPSYYRISTLPTTIHSNFNFLLNKQGIINPSDCRALVMSGHDITNMIPDGSMNMKQEFKSSTKYNKKMNVYKIISNCLFIKIFVFINNNLLNICCNVIYVIQIQIQKIMYYVKNVII